ncbi:hypothetical protein Lal_00021043 [Lupinus albus]|nr:hypothetical protein Lal_00021043 [Lupinus albus]
MLVTEVENWWDFTRRKMETERHLVSWNTFKAKFLHKYFPADLKRQKKMEFLKLEQGNMSVGEYAAKFEELARFCPYSELEVDGRSKCSKFESDLRSKLKRMFRHQEIADFATLVNKCWMYEDDLKVDELATPEKNSPRNYGPKRNHMRERGKRRVEDDRKPYAATTRPRDRSFQRSIPPTVPTEEVSTPMCIKCVDFIMEVRAREKGMDVSTARSLGILKGFVPSWIGDLMSFMPRRQGTTVERLPRVAQGHQVLMIRREFWKSRLSERFSLERERIPWDDEIMGYTRGFSPERELSRLGEKWQFGAVDTVTFSLERER